MGLVDELHDRRFKAYQKAKQHPTMDKAVAELVALHRQGFNIALHVSAVIEEDHVEYMATLRKYGEPRSVIR